VERLERIRQTRDNAAVARDLDALETAPAERKT